MAGSHRGTSGDDTLTGAAGADTFFFGPNYGNDTVTDFTNGEDLIDLTQFPTISSFSDLTITSDDNGVTIDLSAHGGGTVRLEGFDINDLDASDFRFPTVGSEHRNIIHGSDDSTVGDVIYGGGGHDQFHGNRGDDAIYGGAGDDRFYGGRGDDTLEGGADDDIFFFGHSGDNDIVTDFTDGEDLIDLQQFSTISGFSDLTITSDDNGVTIDLTAHGGGTIRLEGFDIDDLDASDFRFPVVGTAGDDALIGDAGENFVYGKAGDDALEGGDGNDHLSGGVGNDTLYGGEGDDRLHGGDGGVARAPILSDSGADAMYGGAGNDALWGDSGDDAMYGGIGNDYLSGNHGNDAMFGGDGNDMFYGGANNDTLDGGEGDDKLRGGTGDDTFVFAAGHGNDTISDFTDGDDLIDLSAIPTITGLSDLQITSDDNGITIDLTDHEGGGTIWLRGFSIDDLDEADFVFAEAPDNAPPDRTNVIDGEGPVELGDITEFSGTGSYESDVNGGTDVTDFFQFTLSESKTVSFVLSSLEYDADLVILSEDGTVLFSSEQSGTDDEGIEQTLEAGTYQVMVEAKEQGENNYVLNYAVEDAAPARFESNATDETFTGGDGADIFVFAAGHGNDRITDFADGEDLIDVTQISGISGFEHLNISADGNDAVIDLTEHGGGTIRLENFDVADLDAEDFQFFELPVEPQVESI